MGVRFQCPNGHKLHVKAELAGKRGICPECQARFVVPSFSGGRALDADAPAPAAGISTPPSTASTPARGGDPAADSIVIRTAQSPHATPSPSSARTPQAGSPPIAQPISGVAIQSGGGPAAQAQAVPSAPAAVAAPTPVSEAVVWYIRPSSGGQFGPATEEVFRQWIATGRVAPDSWVWRTGWPDWKGGSEAVALLNDRPPQNPAAAMAAALEERAGVMPAVAIGTDSTAVDLSTAEQRRLAIKRRKQRMRAMSTVLAVVALLMLTVLVVILAR